MTGWTFPVDGVGLGAGGSELADVSGLGVGPAWMPGEGSQAASMSPPPANRQIIKNVRCRGATMRLPFFRVSYPSEPSPNPMGAN